ncbi:MAG: hypothetical protein EB127_26165, partial [Alphaproteobacteria bacterium]|nr:hypothetical protein [Alphaproteobacteria bacterium]
MNHIDEWRPNIQNLEESVRLLQALRDPTRADHIPALRALETNVTQPEFILHMFHIFAMGYTY